MTGTTLGHYRILEPLGVGGMGKVYVAEDTRLQRRVAVKILGGDVARDEDRLRRFEREAKVVAALDHPNIVTIYSLEEAPAADGEPVHFITMQLVEGVPLSELIPSGGLPVEGLLELAIPIADAVTAAHEHGIVHRDLKPTNIMVSDDGRVRVLDFGLAKLWEEPGDDADGDVETEMATGSGAFLTEEGMILGTGAYMSPEQAEGKVVDHRSDIFSLGIVFYEVVTGERPFRGESKISVISSIMKDTPAHVSEVKPGLPRHLGRILKCCLEKDPERRFQSAKDLRNQLRELREEVLSGELAVAQPSSSGWWRLLPARAGGTQGQLPRKARATGPPRRRGWKALALVAGFAVVVAVAALVGLPALRGLTGSRAGPAPLPDRRAVVVLGIGTGDGDVQTAALAGGLREVLSRRLARLTDDVALTVLPASRARQVSSLERAGLEQGANLVVDGELERTPAIARLSLSLREVPGGEALRTATIEVPLGDPLELAQQALVSVAGMLGVGLEPARRRELTGMGTDVPAAYDLHLRGLGHLGSGTPEGTVAAIQALEQAATLDPGFAAVRAGLGRAYWSEYRGDGDEQSLQGATEACQRAVALDDRQADGHLCLAALYEGTGRPDDAIASLERAAYLEPTHDEAVFGLAGAYARSGREQEAEQTYRAAIELRPDYSRTYFQLGVFLYTEGRLEDSAMMFEEAVSRAPRYRAGHSSLGGVYTMLGRYEDGLAALERALALEPSGPAYSNLATTYFALRRFSDAIGAYQEAIRFEPDSWSSWGNLGDAYYWAPGERDDAAPAYRRAVELVEAHLEDEPDDADAISDLGKFLGMLGEREPALEKLDLARSLLPRDPQVLYHGMLIHLRFDDHDAALDYLERAVEAGYSKPWVRDTPELDALRDSPRFRALLDER